MQHRSLRAVRALASTPASAVVLALSFLRLVSRRRKTHPPRPLVPWTCFSPKVAPPASVEVLRRTFCSLSVAQPRRRRSVRRCRPLRRPVASAAPALAAPLAVESMAQIPVRRRLVCPQQALPRTKQISATNRMFHVKHPSITSFFRFPVHPSPKLRSIRSFPTPSSLARSSMRMI